MSRRHWHSRWPLVGVAITLLFGACSDDGGGSDVALSSSTSVLDETTTSTASTATTTTATSPDPTPATVDSTGVVGPAEWVPVVVDVYSRIHALDVAPNPARVTEVYSENFAGLVEEQQTQEFLASEGLHAEGPAPRLISIEGPTDDAGGTLQFIVTVEYSPFRLVRADGSVFQEITDVPGEVQELLRISPSGVGGQYRVIVKETV